MITKNELELDISEKLTIESISLKRGISNTTVRYWLRKYGLKTNTDRNLQKRYADDSILKIASESTSYTNFLKRVTNTSSGGAYYHYKKRLVNLNFNFETFYKNSIDKKQFRIVGRTERLRRSILNKLLINSGRKVECEDCGIHEWKGKKLNLHIHHKDKNRENNLISNLCYLCPNCHSVSHS